MSTKKTEENQQEMSEQERKDRERLARLEARTGVKFDYKTMKKRWENEKS